MAGQSRYVLRLSRDIAGNIFGGNYIGISRFFQGEMYMLPTALSNVIEQVVKLVLGITLSYLLIGKGLIWAVCGALLGVVCSELVTLVYMATTYFVRATKARKNGVHEIKESMTKQERKAWRLWRFLLQLSLS